jgi:hypothetical protein
MYFIYMFSGMFKPITIFYMFSKFVIHKKCFLSAEHQHLNKYISIWLKGEKERGKKIT